MAQAVPRGIPAPLLLVVYLAVALAPLAIAYTRGGPSRPFLDDFSSAIALVAFAMLLMEFVLSGRVKTVSGRIGIDLTMRYHQLIARALLVFALLHPFLYTTPMGRRLPWDETGQLHLGLNGPSIATGVLAWVLLALLVIMAIWRRRIPFRYEAWRGSHALLSVVVAGLVAHHALTAGRYSQDPVMAGLWLVLLALALASLAYVYLLRPLLQRREPYEITAVEPLAERTWGLRLRAADGEGLAFAPGQFAWLKLGPHPFHITEHPFSIASAPQDAPDIGFVIKEAGDSTSRVGTLETGTTAFLDAPHGNFTYEEREAEGFVFIAGGIGIAPVLSMLRALRAEGDPRPVTLIYGNRHEGQIVAREELAAMRETLKLDLRLVLREPPEGWRGERGELDLRVLAHCLPPRPDEGWLYFVCGPGPMIDAVEDHLQELGVPLTHTISEKFDYD